MKQAFRTLLDLGPVIAALMLFMLVGFFVGFVTKKCPSMYIKGECEPRAGVSIVQVPKGQRFCLTAGEYEVTVSKMPTGTEKEQ